MQAGRQVRPSSYLIRNSADVTETNTSLRFVLKKTKNLIQAQIILFLQSEVICVCVHLCVLPRMRVFYMHNQLLCSTLIKLNVLKED